MVLRTGSKGSKSFDHKLKKKKQSFQTCPYKIRYLFVTSVEQGCVKKIKIIVLDLERA